MVMSDGWATYLAYWKNIHGKFCDRGKVADMKFDVKFRDLGESREIFHEIWRQYLGLICPSRATIVRPQHEKLDILVFVQ